MEYLDFYTIFSKGIYPTELSRNEKIDFFYRAVKMDIKMWRNGYGVMVRLMFKQKHLEGVVKNGHLEVAQWLLSISNGEIEMHICFYAFQESRENGHLEVVQWLWDIGNKSMDTKKISKMTSYYRNIQEITIYYIKHHYYKPYAGPGYLRAIRED
jgi:hypothetical protein